MLADWWGSLFFYLWRGCGLLLYPFLYLYKPARLHLRNLPTPEPGRVWLHGASAGEHQAIAALTADWPQQDPCWKTYASWRTQVRFAWPAPLDLPFVFSSWLSWARPRMLILVEAELWPGWLYHCRKNKIPIVIVNARHSPSQRFWQRVRLWKWLTKDVLWLTQEDLGDLKREAPIPPATLSFTRPVFIAGSTHQEDEHTVLQAWKTLDHPPQLLIAPRHIQRANSVLQACRSHKLTAICVSQLERTNIPAKWDIIILDRFGELAGLYQKACGAFIGGSFSHTIGGHSPAEALAAGLCVIGGPQRHSNPQAWKDINTIRIEQSTDLSAAIRQCLRHKNTLSQPQNISQSYRSRLPEGNCPPAKLLRPMLQPLVPVWRLLSHRRCTPIRLSVPVISVGGISAGGCGKSVVAMWLASQLEHSVVIARGYKRKKSGPEVRQHEHLGDELEMMRRRDIAVISSPNRLAAAAVAIEQGAKWIILDDAFQHRRVHRDINILCIDARWPQSRGVIPVGWAREPWSAHQRADWIWMHNDHKHLPPPPPTNKPIVRSHCQPSAWIHRGETLPLDAKTGECKVIAGIAQPAGFFSALSSLGLHVSQWTVLPDHAPITTPSAGAVMTEKDAARLPTEADVWALQMELITHQAAPLMAAIQQCSRANL